MTVNTARQELTASGSINTTQRTTLTLEIPSSPPTLVSGALLANGTQYPINSFYCPLTRQYVTSLSTGIYEINTIPFSSITINITAPIFYRLTTID